MLKQYFFAHAMRSAQHSVTARPPPAVFISPTHVITLRECCIRKPHAICRTPSTKPHHRRRGQIATCSNVSFERAEIESVKNPRIKDVRALLQRRQRDKQQRILLEGQRLITDALQSGVQPLEVFCTREALQRSDKIASLWNAVCESGAPSFLVSDVVMRSLSDTVSPQGVVAVFEKPVHELPAHATLTLICDEIRDPGNLGTLLRSAAASGVQAVILTTGCADHWGLKALRSGMGAQFHLPILPNMHWADICAHAQGANLHTYVATGVVATTAVETVEIDDRSDGDGSGDGGVPTVYSDVDWRQPAALVIGSEADGASDAAFAFARTRVTIPMVAGVESLNAAMAGTVILFEIHRQRRAGAGQV